MDSGYITPHSGMNDNEKIFPMGGAEVVYLVIHFVCKKQWSEVIIFRFMEIGQ